MSFIVFNVLYCNFWCKWQNSGHFYLSLHASTSHLESDVIKLAAVADGGSAGMDHPVHLHNARAAPRSLPGPLPGGAARGRAAARGFAFHSLLARHFSKSPEVSSRIQDKNNNNNKGIVSGSAEGWKVAAATNLNEQIFHLRVERMFLHTSPLKVEGKLSRNAKKHKSALASCSWQPAPFRTAAWALRAVAENSTLSAQQPGRTDALKKTWALYLHIINSQDQYYGSIAEARGNFWAAPYHHVTQRYLLTR